MTFTRLLAFLAALLSLGVSATSQAADIRGPDDGEIAALAQPELALRGLLARTIWGATDNVRAALGVLGVEKGCPILQMALNREVNQSLPEWRQSVIGAFRDNVPSQILALAVTEPREAALKRISPYGKAIKDSLLAKSRSLITTATLDVASTMREEVRNIDIESVDAIAVLRESSTTVFADRLPCDLLPSEFGS